jgi:hypothetical protein
MGYIFNGSDKIISLETGTTEVSVADLWSRFIDWTSQGDNSKYEQAMRFVGGDSISPTKALGITYFLINGWRIRPQEANHRLVVIGNLYTEPSGENPFLSTLGNFNVTIELQVSNIVETSTQQSGYSNASVYLGEVYIDAMNGTQGSQFPIGTNEYPSNNILDAIIIADKYGITNLSIINRLDIKLNDVVNGYRLKGKRNPLLDSVVLEAGSDVNGCEFEGLTILGDSFGTISLRSCVVGELSGFIGSMYQCILASETITLAPYSIYAKQSTLIECHSSSFNPGVTPIINMGGNVDSQNLVIRSFNGDIKLIDKGGSGDITIDSNAGQITLDSTIDGTGLITIRGLANLVNNSSANVVSTLLKTNGTGLSKEEIREEIDKNSSKLAKIVRLTDELHKINGLDILNPTTVTKVSRSTGAIEQDFTTDTNGSIKIQRT